MGSYPDRRAEENAGLNFLPSVIFGYKNSSENAPGSLFGLSGLCKIFMCWFFFFGSHFPMNQSNDNIKDQQTLRVGVWCSSFIN